MRASLYTQSSGLAMVQKWMYIETKHPGLASFQTCGWAVEVCADLLDMRLESSLVSALNWLPGLPNHLLHKVYTWTRQVWTFDCNLRHDTCIMFIEPFCSQGRLLRLSLLIFDLFYPNMLTLLV